MFTFKQPFLSLHEQAANTATLTAATSDQCQHGHSGFRLGLFVHYKQVMFCFRSV